MVVHGPKQTPNAFCCQFVNTTWIPSSLNQLTVHRAQIMKTINNWVNTGLLKEHFYLTKIISAEAPNVRTSRQKYSGTKQKKFNAMVV